MKRAILKRIPTPPKIAYRRIVEGRALAWHTDPKRWISWRRMAAYKDRHRGQRCFIIGNGPSLKEMDLSPLKDEFTFGMNRFYLMFPKLGFTTTYYAAINHLVIEQCADDLAALPIPTFIGWHSASVIRFGPNIIFVRDPHDRRLLFSTNAARQVWTGATITYVTMQIAYYMGFETVILIGVDHHFVTQGPPHETVVSQGDDPNHFDPAYFGKGFRWQLPDLDTSEQAYKLAKTTYEANGRRILDATVGGKLQVFPKVDYLTLFD